MRKSFGIVRLRRLLLKPFNNGGVLMAKKALSALSWCRGAAIRKESSRTTTLALSAVRSDFCLAEPTQQTPAPADLVRALDCRRLHVETNCRSKWSQHSDSATHHRVLAWASSTDHDRSVHRSLPDPRWHFSRSAQRSLCRHGCEALLRDSRRSRHG